MGGTFRKRRERKTRVAAGLDAVPPDRKVLVLPPKDPLMAVHAREFGKNLRELSRPRAEVRNIRGEAKQASARAAKNKGTPLDAEAKEKQRKSALFTGAAERFHAKASKRRRRVQKNLSRLTILD